MPGHFEMGGRSRGGLWFHVSGNVWRARHHRGHPQGRWGPEWLWQWHPHPPQRCHPRRPVTRWSRRVRYGHWRPVVMRVSVQPKYCGFVDLAVCLVFFALVAKILYLFMVWNKSDLMFKRYFFLATTLTSKKLLFAIVPTFDHQEEFALLRSSREIFLLWIFSINICDGHYIDKENTSDIIIVPTSFDHQEEFALLRSSREMSRSRHSEMSRYRWVW